MKPIIAGLIVALATVAATPVLAADAAQIERGHGTFNYWCGTCHAPDPREGRLLPGTYSLNLKYKGAKPAALEQRDDLIPEVTKVVVRRGIGGMPFFRRTEISNEELDDLAAYLARNVK